jgi:hypothetical protein
LGGHDTGYFGLPTIGIFLPEEAWNIDTKLDDGKPIAGKVQVQHWPQCTNGANPADAAATYLLSSTSKDCMLEFWRAF